MRIAIIGSSQYYDRMADCANRLRNEGHYVTTPHLDIDFHGLDAPELALMRANLENIKFADKVIVFWDGRSPGTWGDICMSFSLGKPIEIGYLEPLSCVDFLKQYAGLGAAHAQE